MITINKSFISVLKQLFISVFLLLPLSACVTTESGVFTKKADKQKAIDSSVYLAKKYIGERKWASAKRHLKNALELDDNSAEVHEAMALVFQNTGETDRAEDHYKKAIRLDSSLSRTRLNYASYLYNFQRYDEAAEQLELVVKDTLYERRGSAFYNLGRCYLALENYEKAEVNFRSAYLMSNRHHPRLIFSLAEAYYYLGDYPQAQRYFDDYSKIIKTKSADALLLGARLAKQFGDKNAVSSYGLALKNLHSRSQQYLDYQREFSHGS